MLAVSYPKLLELEDTARCHFFNPSCLIIICRRWSHGRPLSLTFFCGGRGWDEGERSGCKHGM